MRFFGRTLARRLRVGATHVFTVVAAAGLAGCSAEFWKGRPDVDRVEIDVPDVINEGETVQAIARPLKDNGTVITNGRVTGAVSFSSSDPNVATVHPDDGTVTGIAPGVAVISATVQGKRRRSWDQSASRR